MLFVKPVMAQCPVCIVTVGGGMLLAQKLGIDDLLVAIWISALNTVFSFWLAPKFKIKLLRNPYVFSALMFLMTYFYFDYTDQIGVAANSILGIDKILLGLILGIVSTIIGNLIYSTTKSHNHGKTIFPYAKVVFPVGTVLLVTLIFKFAFNL